MNQYKTERTLCWFYSTVALLLGLTVLCIVVPYNHWRTTLDVCPGGYLENTSCGCILFGTSTFNYFNGGHNSYCLYAVLAPIPVLVYAIIMALFHMYRVCINNVGQYEDEGTTTMEKVEGESIVVSSRTRVSRNDSVVHCWIPTASVAAMFAIYSIVHAAIVTAGAAKTCSQYRSNLVKEIGASGDHASVIHFRLDCKAIFDFMDYIQKDAPNSRRGDFINTGLAIYFALIASWLVVIFWIVITLLTAQRAYKERSVLTCCGN